MDGATIRRTFLDYFAGHGHTVVDSSPLIPRNDPTLFFTNAGMVQFKNVFTGEDPRDYRRATSVQKCLRVSGKHNDLENVGVTPRHHTFFEMLGNFSFGDYFKKDAIYYAWDLLTRVYRLDGDKLWVTIFRDDEEAFTLWREVVGLPESRIVRMGEKDNFWAMGDTGPCGPCSEIHLDLMARDGKGLNPAGPDGDPEGFLEIWNLVFMQYERGSDGTTTDLPRPSIDTGMGLERLAAILQGKRSNYDTDLFMPVIDVVSGLCGVPYGRGEQSDVSMRVIADHARATAFLVSDGVVPSNEARGYVLRRIMRRAIRHGVKLDLAGPFFFKAVHKVVETMGDAYPELKERENSLLEVVTNEEERFADTLDKGLRLYRDEVRKLRARQTDVLPGEFAFLLSDTYGFPLDLTELIAAEDGLVVDREGFDAQMARQRAMARSAWKGSGEQAVSSVYQAVKAGGVESRFLGYEGTTGIADIVALLEDGRPVSRAEPGHKVDMVTRITPFYGESGGQVGDTGVITLLVDRDHAGDFPSLQAEVFPDKALAGAAGDFGARLEAILGRKSAASVPAIATGEPATGGATFRVEDTQIPVEGLIVHRGVVTGGRFQVGDWVKLEVDRARREAIRRNHTATHLLQAALRATLGPHVAQRGSLVAPDRLRFDFVHFKPLSEAERLEVEDRVNAAILANLPLNVQHRALKEAMAEGVTALFGEKYGATVRVVEVPGMSAELCGGTHVTRTGDIGLFRMVSEGGIQAGVRRIEAITGLGVLARLRDHEAQAHALGALLKVGVPDLPARVTHLLAEMREHERQIQALKRRIAEGATGPDLGSRTRVVAGIKVLSAEFDVDSPKALREQADRLRDRLGSGVVCIGSRNDVKATLLVAVTRDLAGRLPARRIVQDLAPMIEGRGGGSPTLAQAGGKSTGSLDKALEAVYDLVAAMAS